MKILRALLLLVVVLFAACSNNEKKEAEAQDTLTEEVDTAIHAPTVDSSVVTTKTTTGLLANPNAILVSCDAVGKINIGDTYQDVERKAGKANLKQDSVFVKGVFQHTFATKVWKGTAGEITINWQESEQPYKTIQNIIIDVAGSTYVTQNGIKLGSPMSFVNKLNGKSFMLIGFSGQNAGTLMNFNGGNLLTQIPCIRAVFELPKMKSYPKEVSEILTPNIVQSNHVAFKIYDPTVKKLIINSKR